MRENSCQHGVYFSSDDRLLYCCVRNLVDDNCSWVPQSACPGYALAGGTLLRRTAVYLLILSAMLAAVLWVCF